MTSAELADILVRAFVCPRQRAEVHAPHMLKALEFADITTPLRLAHWLGQVGHESGRLRYVREIWGPTRQQLRYEIGTTLARALGNEAPGDGRRYMGRGLIQVTGRANYRALTTRLQAHMDAEVPDFEIYPALLESPDWASMSAADYWRGKRLNKHADADDIPTLTRRVNGGTNGLADRKAITSLAKTILGAH